MATIEERIAARYAKASSPEDDVLKRIADRYNGVGSAKPSAIKETRVDGNYPEESGFLDKALNSLDYLGNISRSGIAGALEGEGLKRAGEAAAKERLTTGTELKDLVTKKLGMKDKLRFGQDDNQFDAGDVGDFVTDLGVDVITDPLTLIARGVQSGAKGGLTAAKAGLRTEAAAKYLNRARLAAPGLGALYGGAMAINPEDSLTEKAAKGAAGAAAGAGTVLGARHLGPTISKNVKAVADKAADAYAIASRGSKFGELSKYSQMANAAYDKVDKFADIIKQGRFKALEGLDANDKVAATKVMEDLKTEFVMRRNTYMKAVTDGRNIKEGSDEWNLIKQQADKAITKDIQTTFIPEYMQNVKANVGQAVKKWEDHNLNVITLLNKEAFGLQNGRPANGKGIFGIRWHVEDLYAKKDWEDKLALAEKALEVSGKGKIRQAKSGTRSLAREAVDSDETYGVYAEGFAKQFLQDEERKAINMVAEYRNTVPELTPIANFEKALKGFDYVTGFAKSNLLLFSMSWLKNNYWDNLAKAYVENGLPTMIKTAGMGAFQKDVAKDMWAFYGNKLNRSWQNEDVMDLYRRGGIDKPLIKSLMDDELEKFVRTPSQIAARKDRNIVVKGLEKWQEGLSSTVGRVGSFIEGTARLTTYKNMVEHLKKADPNMPLDKIKDMAAKVAKDTFYDYGDVTHFEKAVMKRVAPFYAFYAKNLPYWTKAFVDPSKASRIANVEHFRRNIGEEPTTAEKDQMSDYIQESAPRRIGKLPGGTTEYAITPSMSVHDAIKTLNLTNYDKQIKDKIGPLLKTGYELGTAIRSRLGGKKSEDLFSGGPLLPSDSRGGKKFLYSAGFKYKLVQDALKKVGIPLDVLKQDEKGNPYTESDSLVVADKFFSTLFPHLLVQQVAGTVGKIQSGRETPDEALGNLLLPTRGVKVTPSLRRAIDKERKRRIN